MSQVLPIPSPARQRRSVVAGDAARAMTKGVIDALLRAESARAAELAPMRLPRAPVATAPLELADALITDARTWGELVASYERSLGVYREIARKEAPDTTDDDLGAAMALFVAVNLQALHGVDADRAVMARLERQLRGMTRRASNWDACSTAQRQTFFERTAILAVLVSGAHARAATQGPAARAKVRAAARQYLQDLLGLNPELLTLGPEGLTVRSTWGVPAACNVAQAA